MCPEAYPRMIPTRIRLDTDIAGSKIPGIQAPAIHNKRGRTGVSLVYAWLAVTLSGNTRRKVSMITQVAPIR
jgi:hypothetical protein